MGPYLDFPQEWGGTVSWSCSIKPAKCVSGRVSECGGGERGERESREGLLEPSFTLFFINVL